MKEIFPGIHLETSYPPYNLLLIETEKGAVAVDVPPRPVHALNWLEQARAALGEVRYVVMTDASPERQMATAFWDIPIIATETTLRTMQAYDEDRARRDFVEDLAARYEDELDLIDNVEPRKPTLAFKESLRLYTDRGPLDFVSIGGAAPGSLWVFMPERALLLPGDTVAVEDLPPLDLTPDSKAWLNTLGTIAHRQRVEHIVPGRGAEPLTREEIEPQRELLRVLRRSARVLARDTDGTHNLEETAQDIGRTFFDQQGQVAVRRIRAGLEHLVAEIKGPESEDEENED